MNGILQKIFIRHARPDDYTACRRLTNQKENRAGFGLVSRITFEDFARRQNDEPRYMLLVAENETGAIAGYVRALRLRDCTRTTIHEICRDAALKGSGVGAALLNAVATASLKDNTNRLFLKAPDGIAATRSYERHGFQCTGIEYPVDGTHRKRAVRTYEKML